MLFNYLAVIFALMICPWAIHIHLGDQSCRKCTCEILVTSDNGQYFTWADMAGLIKTALDDGHCNTDGRGLNDGFGYDNATIQNVEFNCAPDRQFCKLQTVPKATIYRLACNGGTWAKGISHVPFGSCPNTATVAFYCSSCDSVDCPKHGEGFDGNKCCTADNAIEYKGASEVPINYDYRACGH